jgi:hypothetical protein
MKFIVEIPDKKAASLLEVLNSISYVKLKPIQNEKSNLISEIKQSVKEINLVKAGKLKAKPIEALLNEL